MAAYRRVGLRAGLAKCSHTPLRKDTTRRDLDSFRLTFDGCRLMHYHSLSLLATQASATLGNVEGKGGRGA